LPVTVRADAEGLPEKATLFGFCNASRPPPAPLAQCSLNNFHSLHVTPNLAPDQK
jgi:hypothetical protein